MTTKSILFLYIMLAFNIFLKKEYDFIGKGVEGSHVIVDQGKQTHQEKTHCSRAQQGTFKAKVLSPIYVVLW